MKTKSKTIKITIKKNKHMAKSKIANNEIPKINNKAMDIIKQNKNITSTNKIKINNNA